MNSVTVWYDPEADYLEVTFEEGGKTFHQVAEDVFEAVDEWGDVVGFAIFNLKARHGRVEVPLRLAALPRLGPDARSAEDPLLAFDRPINDA